MSVAGSRFGTAGPALATQRISSGPRNMMVTEPGASPMSLIIEDLQKFSREAEDYVHAVIAFTAPTERELEAAAFRVVERLAAVLDAMFEGIPPAAAAAALRPPTDVRAHGNDIRLAPPRSPNDPE